MIKAHNLVKNFGELEAVRGLSLDIDSGEVVGLLGPNGAGKTTTMRMLTTYLVPDGGNADVAGYSITKDSDRVRENIGYLPETPPLYPEMTVLEYLNFITQLRSMDKTSAREAIARVMHRCLLEDVAHRLCSVLSKGFRQRVGLAQAIIHSPEVIILDEPTSGLDPSQIIEIRALIKELGKDHTVILSTHTLPEVTATCNRAIVIADGRVVAEEPIDESSDHETLEIKYLGAIASGYVGEEQRGEES